MKGNHHLKEAVAPYNFVGLPKRLIARYASVNELPRHDTYYKDRISGKIEYVIKAETPILVSDGTYHFFKNIHGDYTIPGNSLRGMVRTNVGILGLSDFTVDIENKRFLYREVATTGRLNNQYEEKIDIRPDSLQRTPGKVKAGYIRKVSKEEYVIIPAKHDQGKTFFRITEMNLRELNPKGVKIRYMYDDQINQFERIEGEDKKTTKNRWINHLKNHPNPKSEPYFTPISFELNRLNNQISIKRIHTFGKLEKNGYLLSSGLMQGKVTHYVINEKDELAQQIRLDEEEIRAYKADIVKKKMDKNSFYALPKEIREEKPIFYAEGYGITYFGFTPFLRIFYDGAIHDGIPAQIQTEQIDYMNAMFGFSQGENSYKSRISFGDAVLTGKTPTISHEKIAIGEPKATSFPQYLKQSNGTDKDSLINYNDKGSFELRGVKHYWFKDKIDPQNTGKANSKVDKDLYPLEEGTQFKGRIYFTNLTKDELGLLLWALYLKGGAYQQIGLAKPYGFGQVKFPEIKLYIEDLKRKYSSISPDFYKEEDLKRYIEEYKQYVQKYFQVDLDNHLSIRELLAIKTTVLSKSDSRYMRLDEFKQRLVLPTILEKSDRIVNQQIVQKTYSQSTLNKPSKPFQSIGPEKEIVGIIKNFNSQKGFGFIKRDDGEKDVFFHISNVKANFSQVKEGIRVIFDTAQGNKGIQALNVKLN